MESFVYKSEKEFIESLKYYMTDECKLCGGCCELYETDVSVTIGEVRLSIRSGLIFKCKNCRSIFLPMHFARIIFSCYQYLLENGNNYGEFAKKEQGRKYQYCEKQDFTYDYRDHLYIPGLCLDEENTDGFLTPVYFKKRAFIYFMAIPEYKVNTFSETYGTIQKEDTSGNVEWIMPYGYNSNGKLVFWLGDLNKMDADTLDILKPFNIESDHKLTDSEFYKAQIKCIFSEPIKEIQIIGNKKKFISNTYESKKIELQHLDEECLQYEKKIVRPVEFTEATVSEVVNFLNKILVEGFSVKGLRAYYEMLYTPEKRDKDYQKWKSINLINRILAGQCPEIQNLDEVMLPLYLLNDYRNLADHLIGDDSLEKKKKHIVECLGVKDFSQQEEIYLKLIDGLNRLFQILAVI